MDEQTIKKELLIAFEYSYLHDSWVEPLSAALDGLAVEFALYRPELVEESKCIWEIVLHMATWNENIVERIRFRDKVSPADGHWPALPEVQDEQAWEAAKARLWKSLDLVKATMEASSLDDLQASPWGIGDLICRFIHNGYHIGQIVKMREIEGW